MSEKEKFICPQDTPFVTRCNSSLFISGAVRRRRAGKIDWAASSREASAIKEGSHVDLAEEENLFAEKGKSGWTRRARVRLKGYRRSVARGRGRFLITRPVEGYPRRGSRGARNMQITVSLRIASEARLLPGAAAVAATRRETGTKSNPSCLSDVFTILSIDRGPMCPACLSNLITSP